MKFATFIALVAVASAEAPKSAKDDLGEKAAAKAAQEIQQFHDLEKTTDQEKNIQHWMQMLKKSGIRIGLHMKLREKLLMMPIEKLLDMMPCLMKQRPSTMLNCLNGRKISSNTARKAQKRLHALKPET